jgi:hypothetical protein
MPSSSAPALPDRMCQQGYHTGMLPFGRIAAVQKFPDVALYSHT